MSLIDRLNAITAFEDQIDEAQAVSEALEGVSEPTLLPAILAMYERNAEEDDFGVFHAFSNWIEELEPESDVAGSTVAAHIAASVHRRPMWKTCELLSMMVPADQAAEALLGALSRDDLTESGRECAASTLGELVEEADPPLSEAMVGRIQVVLGA